MLKSQNIISELKKLVPHDRIISQKEELKSFECDGLTAYKQVPMVVVMPHNLNELSSVLKFCHQNAIPVVARGSGTGLSGGALPHKEGVLLVMTQFNKILEINPHNRWARVQPGVRNLYLSQQTQMHNLYYAPDPSSQIACTIGGNIAENSGGVHCLKYGMTLHNLLEVTMMTMQGELVTYGSESSYMPSMDLLSLVVGSEGLFGIFVEAKVKLLVKPAQIEVILIAFEQIEQAADAVSAIISQGIIPAGLEMMDEITIKSTEKFVQAGYPTQAAALLICEVDGLEIETQTQIKQIQDIAQKFNPIEFKIAKNNQEKALFWSGRKAALPTAGKVSPDYLCMDGSIPRANLAKVLLAIEANAKSHNLGVMNVFHAGDGNLHPLVLYNESKGELETAKKCGGDILEICIQYGGTVTGEHGVGVEKLDQMCMQFATDELEVFHQIKKAMDPSGLFNPNKAIPTLKRCSELGGMHVHKGNLPFPDIERF